MMSKFLLVSAVAGGSTSQHRTREKYNRILRTEVDVDVDAEVKENASAFQSAVKKVGGYCLPEVPKCEGCGSRPHECWGTCGGTTDGMGTCHKCDSAEGSKGACCLQGNLHPTAKETNDCPKAVEYPTGLTEEYHVCVLTETTSTSTTTFAYVQIDAAAAFTATAHSTGYGGFPELPLLPIGASAYGDHDNTKWTCAHTACSSSDTQWWRITSKTDQPGATMDAVRLYDRVDDYWLNADVTMRIFSSLESSQADSPDRTFDNIGDGNIKTVCAGGTLIEFGEGIPVYRLEIQKVPTNGINQCLVVCGFEAFRATTTTTTTTTAASVGARENAGSTSSSTASTTAAPAEAGSPTGPIVGGVAVLLLLAAAAAAFGTTSGGGGDGGGAEGAVEGEAKEEGEEDEDEESD